MFFSMKCIIVNHQLHKTGVNLEKMLKMTHRQVRKVYVFVTGQNRTKWSVPGLEGKKFSEPAQMPRAVLTEAQIDFVT